MRLNVLVSAVLLVSLVVVTPVSAEPGVWVVDLRSPGGASTNVATGDGVRLGSEANRASAEPDVRTGFAVYERRLGSAANAFAAEVRSVVPAGSELAVDIRGLVPRGGGAGREQEGDGLAGDGSHRPGLARGGSGPADGSRSETGSAGDHAGGIEREAGGAGKEQESNGLTQGGSHRPGLAGGQAGPASGSTSQADGGAAGGVARRDEGDAGQWTEWTEILPGAPAVLPVAVTDVQVRVMVAAPSDGQSPVLLGLSVVPRTVPAGRQAPTVEGAGPAYPVFATREGLVGRTTANGHRIRDRDHFVALPSRRGLAAREWGDLPQGKPASQAAYQDGYNNGKDQFGRKVANPAGIDLADGTFWDGLQLKNNAWVTVTYQWVGTNPVGYVRTPGDTLNVRGAPTGQAPIVGLAGDAAQVRIECVAAGEVVAGTQGTTNAWYRLAVGMYVSAAYVSGGGGVSGC